MRRGCGENWTIQWNIPKCGVHKYFRQKCELCVEQYMNHVDIFTLLGMLKKQLYDDVGGRGPYVKYFTLMDRSSHGIVQLVGGACACV